MSDVSLSTFPKNKETALTMLYLESQDLSNLSPADLACKYNEVYEEISKYFKENRKSAYKVLT